MPEPDEGPCPDLPLDVMLSVMRQKWNATQFETAAKIALTAAPFLHPRAAAARPTPGMTDAELTQWIEDGAPRDDDTEFPGAP